MKDKEVEAYWSNPDVVSLSDPRLRKLEESVVLRYLKPHHALLDVGAGRGESTIRYAENSRCVDALERSEVLAREIPERSNLQVLARPLSYLDGAHKQYDIVVSQRVVINMTSRKNQRHLLEQIQRALRAQGKAIFIESFTDGWQRLNDLREKAGKKPIVQHAHNLLLDRPWFEKQLKRLYVIHAMHDFSLYYYLTRVVAQGNELDETAYEQQLSGSMGLPIIGPVSVYVCNKL